MHTHRTMHTNMTMREMISKTPRSIAAILLGLLLGVSLAPTPGSAQTFPYDQEMLLEVKPLPGSRRVPMLEIHPNGRASIDLWCHSVAAEAAVTGGEIKFTFVSAKPENCTPERIELDQAIAKALLEITSWRRRNDIVELIGPTSFRFRISTH